MKKKSDEFVLIISDLKKAYRNVVAVNGLSFSVRRGEIFALLGPNGAGKTTTISIICGLQKSDEGSVIIDGQEGWSRKTQWTDSVFLKWFHLCQEKISPSSQMNFLNSPCKIKIGLCPQNIMIWESLTCFEQLAFMGQMYDLDSGEAAVKATELLNVLGLSEKRNSLAGTLSGGMKRRLNIALALTHHPEILVLDEPQAGLDPQSRILVREYIRSLKCKTTVVLTTHDMDEADRLADRVAIIDYGKLLVLDTPFNLKNSDGSDILEVIVADASEQATDALRQELPANVSQMIIRHDRVFLSGTELNEDISLFRQLFNKHKMDVLDILFRKKTLEDVFISLTGRSLRE